MNQQTTWQEMRVPLMQGWLGSLALHGLLLLTVLPLYRLSPLTLPNEPFHWDVALVQSTQLADEPIQPVSAAEPTVSRQAKRAPVPTYANRANRHVASSADPIVPIGPQTAESVAQTSQPIIASSAVAPIEPVTASISEKPAPDRPQASDSPLQQMEMPANSTTAESSIPHTAAATANETSAMPNVVAQPSPSLDAALNAGAVATPRLDYGWLQQAIFQRLEELKRSSRPLLDDSRLLKVTVKAVVSREGTLLDFAVVKSSGLDRIDQEALALVQRAFPMPLDRPLDREQIAMRIPITYSRN